MLYFRILSWIRREWGNLCQLLTNEAQRSVQYMSHNACHSRSSISLPISLPHSCEVLEDLKYQSQGSPISYNYLYIQSILLMEKKKKKTPLNVTIINTRRWYITIIYIKLGVQIHLFLVEILTFMPTCHGSTFTIFIWYAFPSKKRYGLKYLFKAQLGNRHVHKRKNNNNINNK